MKIPEEISRRISQSAGLMDAGLKANLKKIETASRKIAAALKRGNKIIFFGNGGSAAEAQHFAAEFVNRMVMERRPLPALALTTDSSVLTSIGNDRGFDEIFALQMRALARKGDIAFGITTSGCSPNVLKALAAAKELGCYRIGLGGAPGQKLASCTELCFAIDSKSTPRIQEVHLALGHIICETVDLILFGEPR
jgi:D-sedoheptulose 7-phosphate isomerase